MKFTLSWLKDHLETDAPLNEITDKLTSLGLELESLHDRAAGFGDEAPVPVPPPLGIPVAHLVQGVVPATIGVGGARGRGVNAGDRVQIARRQRSQSETCRHGPPVSRGSSTSVHSQAKTRLKAVTGTPTRA